MTINSASYRATHADNSKLPVIRYCYWSARGGRENRPRPLRPLIHDALKDNYQLIYDDARPDVVVVCEGDGASYYNARSHRIAFSARRYWGSRPLLIGFYGEGPEPKTRFLDYIFSSRPTSKKNICYGMYMLDNLSYLIDMKASVGYPKTQFCNYVYSNDWLPMTKVRRNFCQALMRYRHIDCPGASLNNMKMPTLSCQNEKLDPETEKLLFIRSYKFTIAFENASYPGYVTEKLSHPLAVGSIPIYWGSPDAGEYYNPKAFINCHDYRNFEEVIEKVIEIDKSPELYAEYVNAPRTIPGNRFHDMPSKILDTWHGIADEVVRNKAHSKRRLAGLRNAYKWFV